MALGLSLTSLSSMRMTRGEVRVHRVDKNQGIAAENITSSEFVSRWETRWPR